MIDFIETRDGKTWLPLWRCIISLDGDICKSDNDGGYYINASLLSVVDGCVGSRHRIGIDVNAKVVCDYELNQTLELNATIPETAKKMEEDWRAQNFLPSRPEDLELNEYSADEYMNVYSLKSKAYNLAHFEFRCEKAENLSKAGKAINNKIVEKRIIGFYKSVHTAIEAGLSVNKITHAGAHRIQSFETILELHEPPEHDKEGMIYAWNLGSKVENALKRAGIETAEDFANKTQSDLENIRGIGRDSAAKAYAAYTNYLIKQKEDVNENTT